MNPGFKPHGRPLYSHGPVTYALMALCALSSLCSLAAVIFSVVSLSHRVDTVALLQRELQASRVASATDTCHTLRAVITQAYKPMPHKQIPVIIVSGKRKQQATIIVRHSVSQVTAAQVIQADGLSNCVRHAQEQTALTHRTKHK